MIYIVGLGNPGQEYESTRHNAGRMVVNDFAKKNDFNQFEFDKKFQAQVSEGKMKKESVLLVLPDTFMNKSGDSIKKFVTSKAKVNSLVVVHDDLDLPIGSLKFSFNKSSAGHKGVQSIIKAIGTEEFYRLRIGVSKATSKGLVKKISDDEELIGFIVGKFNKNELEELKLVAKKAVEALNIFVTFGRDKAVQFCNSK